MDTFEDIYKKKTGRDVNFGISPNSVDYVQWLEKLLKKSIEEMLTAAATEDLKEGEEVMVEAGKIINLLEAENEKLKKYVKHGVNCLGDLVSGKHKCRCGLSKLLTPEKGEWG